jgi:hypothetical protein
LLPDPKSKQYKLVAAAILFPMVCHRHPHPLSLPDFTLTLKVVDVAVPPKSRLPALLHAPPQTLCYKLIYLKSRMADVC